MSTPSSQPLLDPRVQVMDAEVWKRVSQRRDSHILLSHDREVNTQEWPQK